MDVPLLLASSVHARSLLMSEKTQDSALCQLNQVKPITMQKWKGRWVANTSMVAQYYGVSVDVAKGVIAENADEFSYEWVIAALSLKDLLLESKKGQNFLLDAYFDLESRFKNLQEPSKLSWIDLAPTPKTSLVYFILDTGNKLIKIGFSKSVEARLNNLQMGNINVLRLLGVCEGGRSEEYGLHKRFAKHRVRSEWFKDCREIRDFIGTLQPIEEKPKNDSFWTPRAVLRLSMFIKDCETARLIRDVMIQDYKELSLPLDKQRSL